MSSPTDSSLHLLLTEREVETTRELELAKARVEELAEHIKRFEAEIDRLNVESWKLFDYAVAVCVNLKHLCAPPPRVPDRATGSWRYSDAVKEETYAKLIAAPKPYGQMFEDQFEDFRRQLEAVHAEEEETRMRWKRCRHEVERLELELELEGERAIEEQLGLQC